VSDITDARDALVLAARRLGRAHDHEPRADSDAEQWYCEELVNKATRAPVTAIDNRLSGVRS